MTELDVDLQALRGQINGLAIGVLEAVVAGLRQKDPNETHTTKEFADFLQACVEDVKALHPEVTNHRLSPDGWCIDCSTGDGPVYHQEAVR